MAIFTKIAKTGTSTVKVILHLLAKDQGTFRVKLLRASILAVSENFLYNGLRIIKPTGLFRRLANYPGEFYVVVQIKYPGKQGLLTEFHCTK